MEYYFIIKEADNPEGAGVTDENGVEYRFDSREKALEKIDTLDGEYIVAEVGTDGGV